MTPDDTRPASDGGTRSDDGKCVATTERDAPQWTERLAHVERRTPIERQADELKKAIEHLGAHDLLTDALNAVDLAMRTLGKWHDEGELGAPPPFVMRPIHIRLLRYAVTYDGVLRLHDDSGLRMGEIAAQGEMFRAGLIEQVPPRDPPIPGPPEFPLFRVTEAGRRALDEADPGRPVPKHGSGGSNV